MNLVWLCPMRQIAASLVLVLSACGEDSLSSVPEKPAPIIPTETEKPVPCKFYAVDGESNLWLVDPDIPKTTLIGSTGITGLTDIAITPPGAILAHTEQGLYQL